MDRNASYQNSRDRQWVADDVEHGHFGIGEAHCLADIGPCTAPGEDRGAGGAGSAAAAERCNWG